MPQIYWWPCPFQRTAARHHADMATFHLQQELILAADPCHDALLLAWRRNMIGEGDHIEQIRADTAHVYPLSTNDQLPLHEPILLVEFLNEPPIDCPSHGDEIGDPGVHGVPRFDDTRIIQVIPQVK